MMSECRQSELIDIVVNGQALSAREGQTIAAALSQHGIAALRQAPSGALRGVFCGMGTCYECLVTVDGVVDQRACITPVHQGMRIELDRGGRDETL